MSGLIDDHRRVDSTQLALLLELFDLDSDSVRQLFAEVAEQFFAERLGSKKAL